MHFDYSCLHWFQFEFDLFSFLIQLLIYLLEIHCCRYWGFFCLLDFASLFFPFVFYLSFCFLFSCLLSIISLELLYITILYLFLLSSLIYALLKTVIYHFVFIYLSNIVQVFDAFQGTTYCFHFDNHLLKSSFWVILA